MFAGIRTYVITEPMFKKKEKKKREIDSPSTKYKLSQIINLFVKGFIPKSLLSFKSVKIYPLL